MSDFPYVIDANKVDQKWIKDNGPALNELLHTHGAILFRNYRLKGKKDFQDFIGLITPPEELSYDVSLSPHQLPFFLKSPVRPEMAHQSHFPKKVFFFCEHAPSRGGETPIVDLRKVYRDISEEIRAQVETNKIVYSQHFKNGTNLKSSFARTGTWQFEFKTLERRDVENYCQENNYQFQWQKDGSVILETPLPGTLKHRVTQEKVWFNSIHFFQLHHRILGKFLSRMLRFFVWISRGKNLDARFENGEYLSVSEVSEILDAFDKNQVIFRWQVGDVLYLDNTLTAHGRNSFYGKRKILMALTKGPN
jgi:alpha-ketoglutarate-dependent taurine dioxygenase